MNFFDKFRSFTLPFGVPECKVSVDMLSDLLARLGYIMGDQSLQRLYCTRDLVSSHTPVYSWYRYTLLKMGCYITPLGPLVIRTLL